MPKENLTLLYTQAAKEIEKKTNLSTTVIKLNPHSVVPWITSASGYTLYVIAPKNYPQEKFRELHDEYTMRGIHIQQMYPVEEMLNVAKQRPDALKSALGGMGFLVPFLFNHEVYGNYRKEFVRRFGQEFGERLKQEINARIERHAAAEKVMKEDLAERQKRFAEKQKTLVGPLEEEELTEALGSMAKYIHEKKGNVLVVFDKSGRPLGGPLKKILKQAYNQEVAIYFIDPDIAKHNGDKAELRAALEKEQPNMMKAIRGQNVMLIDDQVWQGHSFEAITKILKHYNPKSVHSMPMSQYPAELQPSWRTQEIHRVMAPDLAGRKFVSKRRNLTHEEKRKLLGMHMRMNRVAKNAALNLRARK